MKKLALFDIDETLTMGIEKGFSVEDKIAIPQAMKEIYEIDANEWYNLFNIHGMTKQQIFLKILEIKGIDEETSKSKLEELMKRVVEIYNKHKEQEKCKILGGVERLLQQLKKRNVLMGIVTGNLEEVARGKLATVGIEHYFKIGGFGNEHIDRTELVKIAIKKAEQNYGFEFDNNVFHTGDAPQDIKAGNEAGIKTIGVATGIYSKEQLKEAGADYVFDNLEDTDKFLEIIGEIE